MSNEEVIEESVKMLEGIIGDRAVPRNIRETADEVKAMLLGPEDPSTKAASVISILNEMEYDPNIPMYTRSQIWKIVGQLETVIE